MTEQAEAGGVGTIDGVPFTYEQARIVAAREAAAEARGAERALREAADEADEIQRIGETAGGDLSDDEKRRFNTSALADLHQPSWDSAEPRVLVAGWLRDRAAAAARGAEGGA